MNSENNRRRFFFHSDQAIMGFPMTLLIITIISGIIIILFVISAERINSFQQKEEIESIITSICGKINTMQQYSHEENQLTMTITFPPIVKKVILGKDTFTYNNSSQNNSSLSYSQRCCILYQLTNGERGNYNCPIAVYDQQKNPLEFTTGTYTITLKLQKRNNEVYAIGSIK